MKKKICVVIANYYPKFSIDLTLGVSSTLKKAGIKIFKVITVPGIFEIPATMSRNIKKYDAMIALGCVIKGETPHFDYISRSTINALMMLSIKHKKPIGNGIITCLNRKQASLRSDPKKKNKGSEAAKAILSVLKN